MLAKLFAGLTRSVGVFLVATGLAGQKPVVDCCTEQLACCAQDEACCLDCCAQGLACCEQIAPCCALLPDCCKAGAACCDEGLPCCSLTVQPDAKDCCSAAK